MNLKNTNKLFPILIFIKPGVFTLRLKRLGLSCFVHKNNMSALQRESIKLCVEKSEDGTNIEFHEKSPSTLKIKLRHLIGLLYPTSILLAPNLNNNSRAENESKGIVDQRTTENNNYKSVSPKTHSLSKIILLSDSGTMSGYTTAAWSIWFTKNHPMKALSKADHLWSTQLL
jgi:hypothetical protein